MHDVKAANDAPSVVSDDIAQRATFICCPLSLQVYDRRERSEEADLEASVTGEATPYLLLSWQLRPAISRYGRMQALLLHFTVIA